MKRSEMLKKMADFYEENYKINGTSPVLFDELLEMMENAGIQPPDNDINGRAEWDDE